MIRWTGDEKLLNSPALANSSLYAEKLAHPIEEVIVTQYVGLTPNQASQEFGPIYKIRHDLGMSLSGTGLEPKAGIDVSSAMAINDSAELEDCYAVELVQKVLEPRQPFTVPYTAGKNENKVSVVLGGFNAMEAPGGF
jgi:hypothetical protein